MGLSELNQRIESSPIYQFGLRHKKVLNIIQGIIIILLLISINSYVVRDHFIKKQIKENCGYVNSNYKCVCEKHYVENWEQLKLGNLNLTEDFVDDVSMVG